MKSKKSPDFREESDALKGKRKHKLAPIKKQKSKKTQFFDEIEEFEDEELDYKVEDLDDLYEDLDDFDDYREDD
jgi:hypothetical protein